MMENNSAYFHASVRLASHRFFYSWAKAQRASSLHNTVSKLFSSM